MNCISGNGGMADAPDLGSGAARCGGSSPLSRTTSITRLSDELLKAFLRNQKVYTLHGLKDTKMFISIFVSFVVNVVLFFDDFTSLGK